MMDIARESATRFGRGCEAVVRHTAELVNECVKNGGSAEWGRLSVIQGYQKAAVFVTRIQPFLKIRNSF